MADFKVDDKVQLNAASRTPDAGGATLDHQWSDKGVVTNVPAAIGLGIVFVRWDDDEDPGGRCCDTQWLELQPE